MNADARSARTGMPADTASGMRSFTSQTIIRKRRTGLLLSEMSIWDASIFN
ncbi:hypothetical protein D3C73_1638450 [compost metagenome]